MDIYVIYDKILKRHHVLIGELIDFSPVLEDEEEKKQQKRTKEGRRKETNSQ